MTQQCLQKCLKYSFVGAMVIGGAIAFFDSHAFAKNCPPRQICDNPGNPPHQHEPYHRHIHAPQSQIPPRELREIQERYPQATSQLQSEDPQAIEKLRQLDPNTVQRLQQLAPNSTEQLQRYAPHLRQQ
ncbi:MAG: hypothetical protein PUP92_17385 [Rhizonema sp. PD38]|nr:hypothetical protein [Rhizonema sp. PD38]